MKLTCRLTIFKRSIYLLYAQFGATICRFERNIFRQYATSDVRAIFHCVYIVRAALLFHLNRNSIMYALCKGVNANESLKMGIFGIPELACAVAAAKYSTEQKGRIERKKN